jgi:phage baseplate assembly protein V
MANPAQAIKSLVSYGKLLLTYAGKPQQVQVEGNVGTVRDKVHHAQPYGFSSRPLAGAECVTLNMGGNAAQALCILIADRRYVLELAEGEAALHDDQGQAVHLTRDGIVIKSDKKVTIDSPEVEMSGKINLTGVIKINGITQMGN